MARAANSTPTCSTAEEWLLAAVRAKSSEQRERYAERGLAFEDIETDTAVLLLQQLYIAYLERPDLARALGITARMSMVGALPDVVHHDRARVLRALGRDLEAVQSQRLAARVAPPKRKSFQLWSLATLEHHRGDAEGALATLSRAMRYAVRDRALLKAHAAYIRLEAGLAVRGVSDVIEALKGSKNSEGYGQFLLGMIAYHMGEERLATSHLTAFMRRNASADAAKVLTLEEELRRARMALATIENE